jgi:hypothetical protein
VNRAGSARAVRDVLAKGISELGFERFSFQQIIVSYFPIESGP